MSTKVSAATLAVVAVMLAAMVGMAACGGETPEPTASPTATETPAETATPTLTPSSSPSANLDGAALVQERCTTCHSIDRIEAEDGDAATWAGIVDSMIARGADLTDQERQAVVDHLAATYPDN